jgi:hypothetical protein
MHALKFVSLVLLIAIFLPAHSAVEGGGASKGFPTTVVPIVRTFAGPVPCDKASNDTVSDDVCRIDVNVELDAQDRCVVTMAAEVNAAANYRIVEWVVKSKDNKRQIDFVRTKSLPPILMRDGTGFDYFGRLGPRKYIGVTRQKSSSYYYVFLQWYDKMTPTEIHYCEAYDPIINNDDPGGP